MVALFQNNYRTVEQEISASKIKLEVNSIDRATIRSCMYGPFDNFALHKDSTVVGMDNSKELRQRFLTFEAELKVFDCFNLITLHHCFIYQFLCSL